MKKKPAIFEDLERIAPLIPAPLYWEDTNSIILGGNEAVFEATGALFSEAYIKT